MIHILYVLHYRKAYVEKNIIAYFISHYVSQEKAQVMPLNQLFHFHFHFHIVSFEVYSYGLKLISMDNI